MPHPFRGGGNCLTSTWTRLYTRPVALLHMAEGAWAWCLARQGQPEHPAFYPCSQPGWFLDGKAHDYRRLGRARQSPPQRHSPEWPCQGRVVRRGTLVPHGLGNTASAPSKHLLRARPSPPHPTAPALQVRAFGHPVLFRRYDIFRCG